MVRHNLSRQEKVVAVTKYAVVSPVDEDVAKTLSVLAEEGIDSNYWIGKPALEAALAGLGKENLEIRLVEGKEIFERSPSQIKEQFPTSAIYYCNAQRGLVRVTPTPFGTGEQIEQYFAIKSPEYAGR